MTFIADNAATIRDRALANWRARYLADKNGQPIPMELIEAAITESQPFRAWDLRAMLTIPLAERALYELPDDRLNPEAVLATFRGDTTSQLDAALAGLGGGAKRGGGAPRRAHPTDSELRTSWMRQQLLHMSPPARAPTTTGRSPLRPRAGPACGAIAARARARRAGGVASRAPGASCPGSEGSR
jgi:hypothetical protein